MKSNTLQFLIQYFAVCFLLLSCQASNNQVEKKTVLPFFNTADFTPVWIGSADSSYKDIHQIAPFSLINQRGEIVNNQTYANKIYVADFFFVSCSGICPKLTKNMGALQETFKNDPAVLLLSHTVMPEKDSVSVLQEYALENNVLAAKWNLVTGDKEAIYALARTSYFADEDFKKTQEASTFIHTENFVLIDGKGRIRGVYNGTLPLEVARLTRHITLLKNELKQ